MKRNGCRYELFSREQKWERETEKTKQRLLLLQSSILSSYILFPPSSLSGETARLIFPPILALLPALYTFTPFRRAYPECIGEETRLTLSRASAVQLYLLRDSLSQSLAAAKCCGGDGKVVWTRGEERGDNVWAYGQWRNGLTVHGFVMKSCFKMIKKKWRNCITCPKTSQ